MPRDTTPPPPPAFSWLRFVFQKSLPLETETSLFIFLSALDLFMTWILLSTSGGQVVEGNPVARYFLEGWGQKGFVGFKFGCVAFICVITQLIALKRPDTAKFVLQLGTLVVGCVVIYSTMLLLRTQGLI